MLRKSFLFILLHTVLVTTDEPGGRRVQTINTAPITIHVPFPRSQESRDANVVSDNTEGTYLVPVTEHRRPEPQPVNLVLNLRLIMDREEKKPERTEAITVLTEPSPQPPARDNSPEFVAHPLKIMTQDSNPTVRPTPPATQPVPQYVPDGLASGPAANVESTRVSSSQSPSSKSYGVVPSYLLVPKRPVLHNVRSNTKTDVPEVPLPEFRRKLLSEHNKKRMLHGVPPLTLDDKLNKAAQHFVDELARQKEAQRSPSDSRKGEGENIALRCSMKGSPLSEAHAANLWYDEGRRFNWMTLSSTPNTERFTQMVWKNTTRVGFGRAQFKDNDGRACFVIVARYEPIGNIVGKFADNVLKPNAAKSVRALKPDA